MPNENAQNTYNKPGVNIPEYDEFSFSELENDDLFWRTNVGIDVQPHRKLNADQGINLKSREIINVEPHTKVYIKV